MLHLHCGVSFVLPDSFEGYGVMLWRWRPSDAELLHRAVSESLEHLTPWMEWTREEPRSVSQRHELLIEWESEWQRGGDANFAVVVGRAVAGGCGLHRRRGPTTLEIGYWTHPSFVRRRVATAAARLLTDAAFSVPEIERVEIHHDKANFASRGVAAALGYRFVGEHPDQPRAPAEVGIDCTWRVSREEWELG